MAKKTVLARKSWRNHLWIVTCLYFALGIFNIAFAWLGMIFFLAPLLIAIFRGDKVYCNKYCDRGRLFRFLGANLGVSRGWNMPAWLKTNWFRYLFMAYFFAMFGSVIVATVMVALQGQELDSTIKILATFRLPWDMTQPAAGLPPWAVQFAFGFYSFMLTSLILGLISMVFFKPRSWCVYCPMGTMTQMICKAKSKNCGVAE